jgi:ribosomal protein S24E
MNPEIKLRSIVQTPNSLLRRIDLRVDVQVHGGSTPSRKLAHQALANKLGVDPMLLILTEIRAIYGTGDCEILAHLYEDSADLERIEPKHLIRRRAVMLGLVSTDETEE